MSAVTADDIYALTLAITQIDGLLLSAESLEDDIAALIIAYPSQESFRAAGASTVRALTQLVRGTIEGASLKYDLADWHSLHYQSMRAQNAEADMRIVYKKTETESIELGVFGNRHVPANIYWVLRNKQR